MEVVRTNTFIKQTKGLKDRRTKERLFKQIKKIIENPETGYFLSYEKGVRKAYIPPYRLLYMYSENKLYLMRFEHRDKIYKNLRSR